MRLQCHGPLGETHHEAQARAAGSAGTALVGALVALHRVLVGSFILMARMVHIFGMVGMRRVVLMRHRPISRHHRWVMRGPARQPHHRRHPLDRE